MIGKGTTDYARRGQATDFTDSMDILRTASPKNLNQSVKSVALLLREIRLLDQVDRDGADPGLDPDDDSRPTIFEISGVAVIVPFGARGADVGKEAVVAVDLDR